MRPISSTTLFLFLASTPCGAVDYDKIERKLIKEPTYQKAPQYALLLFGRDAPVRIWAVTDGDVLYLDRNGDGDLTGKDERFEKNSDAKDIEIADPDGKTRFVITDVRFHQQGDPPQQTMMVSVDIKGPVSYSQYCGTPMKDTPQKASMAHFHGPLSAGPTTINWKLPPRLALITGDKPTELPALVGTMSDEHGCWVVVRSHNGDKSAFSEGVYPVVDIEFPAKTPGAAPVKQRYNLDKFC